MVSCTRMCFILLIESTYCLHFLQKELSEFVEDERTIKDEQLQEAEVSFSFKCCLHRSYKII